MNGRALKIIAVCGLFILFSAVAGASVQARPVRPALPDRSPQQGNVKANVIDFIGWSAEEPHGCEIEAVDTFPSGTEKVYASFEFNDAVSEGDSIKVIWYQGEESITTDSYDVTDESTCAWFSLFMKKDVPLGDGDYRIELKLGKTVIGAGETEIGGKALNKKEKKDGGVDETIVWADETDNENCPVNSVDGYPSGAMEINAVVPDAPHIFEEGETYKHIWYVDDEDSVHNKMIYKGWACFLYTLNNGDEALWDAVYRLEVYNNDKMILRAETEVGDQGEKPIPEGIMLQGTLKDADTGKAIKGGTIVLLNPGISYNEWVAGDMPDEDVYSKTESDNKGVWRMEDALERGITYPIAAVGTGYKSAAGEVEVEKDADDVIEMDIELESK